MLTPGCPNCGHSLPEATNVIRHRKTGPVLMAGDFSVCYYCLAILRFYNSSIHTGGLGLLVVVEESAPADVLDVREQLRRFKLVRAAGLN